MCRNLAKRSEYYCTLFSGPCRRFAAAPTNGEIVKQGLKHKETVRFSCKPGFQMVGTPDRLCNFGVWDDSALPRCEGKVIKTE